MSDNFIVDEIHRIREEILEEYGGDLKLMIADLQRKTEEAARAGHKMLLPNQDNAPKKTDSRKVG